MAKRGRLVTAILCVGLLVSASHGSDPCQVELNHNAAKSMWKTETQLESLRAAIRARYVNDQFFLTALLDSQLAWTAYRNAQLHLIFPAGSDTPGTVYPLCFAIWKARFAGMRIAELKSWRDGVAQGDVCTGSIRINPDLPSIGSTQPSSP